MLLVPVDQPGVEIRPIENLAGSGEFSECFFTGARTDADLVVGDVDEGWRVVMGTLGMERGAALIPMQLAMEREVFEVIATAQASGAMRGSAHPPTDSRRLHRHASSCVRRPNGSSRAWCAAPAKPRRPPPPASSSPRSRTRRLGELAMDVEGPCGQDCWRRQLPGGLSFAQRTFLLSRAETIYGGTSEIQRNIISERVLGLPR